MSYLCVALHRNVNVAEEKTKTVVDYAARSYVTFGACQNCGKSKKKKKNWLCVVVSYGVTWILLTSFVAIDDNNEHWIDSDGWLNHRFNDFRTTHNDWTHIFFFFVQCKLKT